MNILMCLLMVFSYSGAETDMIMEINRTREVQGVEVLAFNGELSRLARYRSEEMAELGFSSHSLLYGQPDEMLVRFGVPFSKAGVNIAKGQENAKQVVGAWLSSGAHAANLLDADFTSAGVGLAYHDGLPYWTLILISSA